MVLSRMYNVDVVIIRPDFVWLSRAVAPITCGIVLVQDSSGNFLGTKTKNLVYICHSDREAMTFCTGKTGVPVVRALWALDTVP